MDDQTDLTTESSITLIERATIFLINNYARFLVGLFIVFWGTVWLLFTHIFKKTITEITALIGFSPIVGGITVALVFFNVERNGAMLFDTIIVDDGVDDTEDRKE